MTATERCAHLELIGSDTFNPLYYHYDTGAEFDRREKTRTERIGSALGG